MQPQLELTGETTGLLQPILAIALTYAVVILFVRIAGLRSFAKMSAFDFAATIATGSLIAATAIGSTPIWSGLAAIAGLFIAQAVVTFIRGRGWGHNLIDNRPIVLMDGPEVITANLRKAGMIEADLAGQLRQAGVASRDEVRAVILETSGDVSVLTGPGGLDALDELSRADLKR